MSSSQQQGGQSASGANASNYIRDQSEKTIKYSCGDCNAIVSLTTKSAIRCGVCGYRVLYKLRTEQVVQFEAR